MRGILWRWLFFLGTIFWISLCLADYHHKYLQMNLQQMLKNMDIKIEPPAPPYYQIVPQKRKLQPPTPSLTFWKFLSIVFSVSAIVIIKRLSTFRKKNLPVSSCSDFDLIRAPYGSFITRVPPISQGPIYHQEFHVARLETSAYNPAFNPAFNPGYNGGDTRPTALVGVKIVQKKLEDLENNIATLKQRISHNSTSNPSSFASDSMKKVFEQKLAANQSYFGPVISNTDTHSSVSSNSQSHSHSPQSSEMKTRKLDSRPVTPASFHLTVDSSNAPHVIPVTPSITKVPSIHTSEKIPTPDKSSRKSGGSSNSKEVKFNRKTFEFDSDIISLKDLKDSMSISGKDLNYEARKICPISIQRSQNDLKSNPVSITGFISSKPISKRSTSRKSRTNSKYQLSEVKIFPESRTNSTTFPSISSRKSQEGSTKSFPMDCQSTTKVFTDSNSTTSSLASIRKKRFLKSIKDRKKEFKAMTPMSTSIATYLSSNFHSSFPNPRLNRHESSTHGSYAAINRKKAHTMKELRANTSKIKGYDQISVSSSNDSSDSIDKFVAKILKPESDVMLLKNSSDDMSMASTSISSLTASSSTFISGGSPKFDSVTNSIRSILPLSRTTVSSNFSSLGHSRNIPAGAEPLSSGESIVEKSGISKYGTNLAIHSLAMNYLQTLEQKKFESDSQEKIHDSGSEFSFTTKSVLEKYKSKTKDSSATSSHQNILEDKYWLLHW